MKIKPDEIIIGGAPGNTEINNLLNRIAEPNPMFPGCTTHHKACDCREAKLFNKISFLRMQLAKAREAILTVHNAIVETAPDTVWISNFETAVDHLHGALRSIDESGLL